jgi:two-component system, NarL family, response regulator NreC
VTIRVLLADDHRVITEGLRSLIDSQGDMRVVGIATTGVEAVRRALETTPDVVVMDQAMPEMNGTEAAQMIRERRSQTRVIILSMHSNTEHVHRALQAGASGYVLKSSAGEELVEAIRAVHAGRRYLSAPLAEDLLERMINPPEDPWLRLSARERQVLKMLAEGHSVVRIAVRLSLSRKTVETYRERAMEKLNLADLPALVKFAVKHQIVALE